MFINDYKPADYRVKFELSDGDHALLVKQAEVVVSENTGKQMIKIDFTSSETMGIYSHYMVEGKYFDSNMTKLFDCMGVPHGDFNFNNWVGKEVIARFKNEPNEWFDKQGVQHVDTRSNLKTFIVPDENDGNSAMPSPSGNAQIPNGVQVGSWG